MQLAISLTEGGFVAIGMQLVDDVWIPTMVLARDCTASELKMSEVERLIEIVHSFCKKF